jgi:hypothetical protein
MAFSSVLVNENSQTLNEFRLDRDSDSMPAKTRPKPKQKNIEVKPN